ncbi:hypothetical protein PR202_gb17181 [Eleusine coracana subsp. coracana]|uniref:Uncharacterized protein n=1 Tax=Eleusine coracana subsp. coracana TaxID=191504 RepID=A0AAV5F3Y3_ELECO|nr:hypothetical protein PR202_gb17181 [Eleusine coracana subsp. coracana]
MNESFYHSEAKAEALEIIIVLDMATLMGAYIARSTREVSPFIYINIIVLATVIYTARFLPKPWSLVLIKVLGLHQAAQDSVVTVPQRVLDEVKSLLEHGSMLAGPDWRRRYKRPSYDTTRQVRGGSRAHHVAEEEQGEDPSKKRPADPELVNNDKGKKQRDELCCEVCEAEHLTAECPIYLGPKPAAIFCGFAGDLGFFQILTDGNIGKTPKRENATAHITIKQGIYNIFFKVDKICKDGIWTDFKKGEDNLHDDDDLMDDLGTAEKKANTPTVNDTAVEGKDKGTAADDTEMDTDSGNTQHDSDAAASEHHKQVVEEKLRAMAEEMIDMVAFSIIDEITAKVAAEDDHLEDGAFNTTEEEVGRITGEALRHDSVAEMNKKLPHIPEMSTEEECPLPGSPDIDDTVASVLAPSPQQDATAPTALTTLSSPQITLAPVDAPTVAEQHVVADPLVSHLEGMSGLRQEGGPVHDDDATTLSGGSFVPPTESLLEGGLPTQPAESMDLGGLLVGLLGKMAPPDYSPPRATVHRRSASMPDTLPVLLPEPVTTEEFNIIGLKCGENTNFDFHSLPRCVLQKVCKMNGIRANTTNKVMADSIRNLARKNVAVLDQVTDAMDRKESLFTVPGPQASLRQQLRQQGDEDMMIKAQKLAAQ